MTASYRRVKLGAWASYQPMGWDTQEARARRMIHYAVYYHGDQAEYYWASVDPIQRRGPPGYALGPSFAEPPESKTVAT